MVLRYHGKRIKKRRGIVKLYYLFILSPLSFFILFFECGTRLSDDKANIFLCFFNPEH